MVKRGLGLLLVCAACATTGCIAAIGNSVTIPDRIAARKPVAVDGRIYVVDVRTGRVMALEPNAVQNASSFESIPCDPKSENSGDGN